MDKKSKVVVILSIITTAIFLNVSICQAAEAIVRTITIQYPSKAINGSTTVIAVPGAQYTFQVVGSLPSGTHIEWRNPSPPGGKWSGSVLTPYGATGSYSITAVLVGGEGEGGSSWQATASGSITNPLLTFSLPSEDKYFTKAQTGDHTVNTKVTVTRSGGAQLQGVAVKFIAAKQSGGQESIGNATSNASGEAGKNWTVPVSDTDIFTLKAGTGSTGSENQVTCAKKVYVVMGEPTNADFSAELGSDIIRALAWQEGAGWPASPRWNHYDSNGQPLVNEVGAWGIMNVRKGVWETWFEREYHPDYKPHGYTVCEWNEMAWDWETNIENGKYIHQTYMPDRQTATQKTWPDTAANASTPNREDLASYGYLWGETAMQDVDTQAEWNDIILNDTHTQNIRGYKSSKPWE